MVTDFAAGEDIVALDNVALTDVLVFADGADAVIADRLAEGADPLLLASYVNTVRFVGIDSATLTLALADGDTLLIDDPSPLDILI